MERYDGSDGRSTSDRDDGREDDFDENKPSKGPHALDPASKCVA
jgi:hypothetical protein